MGFLKVFRLCWASLRMLGWPDVGRQHWEKTRLAGLDWFCVGWVLAHAGIIKARLLKYGKL